MNDFKTKAQQCALSLVAFLKNPIQGMRSLPEWPWQELVLVLLSISAICGAAQGIVSGKVLSIFAGIIFYPIGITILVGLFSGFFYYVFLFFFKREVDFKRLFTNVTFATIPSLLVSIVTPVLPPVQLVGLLATLFLLVVGFTENFQMPKRAMAKFLAGIFLIYLIFWIYSSINFKKTKDSFRDQATPESIDILEQELKSE